MHVLLLPGIWPPDVGGPASHGPELARFLTSRAHAVTVVTMADREPTERPGPVWTIDRGKPFPVRYSRLTLVAARAARGADVVYASATYAAAAVAATIARRPLVAKLVSDPAYERARRYGLFAGAPEEFQAARGAAVASLRSARTAALRRARAIVIPSAYLGELAASWGLDSARIRVLPNPAPAAGAPTPRSLAPNTFVFAGRLTRQKALTNAIDAVAAVPGSNLIVIGDGPDRERLLRHVAAAGLNGRIRFEGALPRAEVLEFFAGARAAVLSSEWENLPHAAVEALSVGTPVVATAVGGVPEIVRDGVNGLLVPPGSSERLAAALSRLVESPELADKLAASARESVAALDAEGIYGQLESILAETVL